MPSIIVNVNLDKDVRNWLGAISKKSSHGMDWTSRIPVDLALKIKDKTEEEIKNLVTNYLTERYATEKDNLEQYARNFMSKGRKENEIYITVNYYG